jgi:hypothetical protein
MFSVMFENKSLSIAMHECSVWIDDNCANPEIVQVYQSRNMWVIHVYCPVEYEHVEKVDVEGF